MGALVGVDWGGEGEGAEGVRAGSAGAGDGSGMVVMDRHTRANGGLSSCMHGLIEVDRTC